MSNNATSVCLLAGGVYGYFHKDITNFGGGRQRQLYLIGNGLNQLGYDVNLIVKDHGQPTKTSSKGIEFIKGYPNNSSKKHLLTRYKSIWEAMDRANSDIYYLRGDPHYLPVVLLFCKYKNKKLIYCVSSNNYIDPEELRERYEIWERAFLRFSISLIQYSDKSIVLTNKQKEILDRNYSIQSTVVPVCYTIPEEEPLDQSERAGILWIGRITSASKQPRTFIELAKSLPEYSFTMIGLPEEGEEKLYEQILDTAATLENLEFIEGVAPDRIHQFYNTHRVFINTTYSTGFGNTTLEAWRYATPVITTDLTFDENIDEHDLGIKANSHDELVKSTKCLVENSGVAEYYGRNGQEFLKNNFSKEKIIQQYNDMILGL